MRRLWLRLGVGLQITEAEEKIILSSDSDVEIAETVRKIVAEGRFALDGDSYIPDSSVESFNEIYGTDYEEADVEFDC